jgi:ABC-type antimicrobial peptide transport system permease subunit
LTEYHHADATNIFYGKGVPFPMPGALKTAFPELEQVTTVYTDNNDQILVLDESGKPVKKFKEEKGVFFTDPSFFKTFDYKWLAGDVTTAMSQPNMAVLTKEIAEKYFGDWKTAMGKTLKWNNQTTLKVSGILETIPDNTDLQLKIVVPMGTSYTAQFLKSTNWDGTNSSYGCFVVLPPHETEAAFNTRLRAFSKKMEPAEDKDSHIIEALSKIHFDTATGNFSNTSISPELIRALWLIALFILLIACVNFINLTTAQAVNRAREVGVRKVLGGNRAQLRLQFVIETFLIVFLSVILAVGITAISLPMISKIIELPLSINVAHNPALMAFLLGVLIIVTMLAGFYPSIILSRFNPITALKSKLAVKSTRGFSLRRALVVFQFIIAQGLIIGTLIIVKQMDYFKNTPLGFDKDAVVNVPLQDDSIGLSKLDYVRDRLAQIKGVEKVTFNSNTPVEDNNDSWSNFKYDGATKETDFYAITKWTDANYVPTYEIPLVAGRNLEPSDTGREFLVNESLVKKLGLRSPEEILNKQIDLWGFIKGPVIGVVKDFHNRSFRTEPAPLLMTTFKRLYFEAGIKLSTTDMTSTMHGIEKLWGEVYPDFVFEYQFLDAKVENFYKEENKLSQLYRLFAIIAIFLSCLGLYGLASFMAVQRTKEVGIRKVLGASAGSIVYLFSKEFILLVAIAFVIAAPIAWYFMHQWLQDYVYRINIGAWIFIGGGLASVAIALLTVSFQAIKAALANPVKSLRTE